MIAAVAAFGRTMAQSNTFMNSIRDASLPVSHTRDAVCEANPATMVWLDTVSISTIGVSACYDRQSQAVIQQLGKGGHDFSVNASSYTRLRAASCLWGNAGFKTGVTRDVRWTECIDYLRLAPYVLGDGVGGDLSAREYTFSGGYGKNFGRWSVGATAAYRAEIAYRDRDPRVKTVVSDLALTLGGAYSLTSRYALGLDVAIDIYRQNCDVDFYNPVNDINTYPLTGLGTYYKRFTGCENSGYQSDGWSAGMQLVSTDGYGFSSAFGISRGRMEQRLRNYNNLTLAYADHSDIGFLLTHVSRLSSSLRFAPSVNVSVGSRKGVENLFGTSSGGSYDIIGSRSNYRQSLTMATLTLPLEISRGTSVITATPRVTYGTVSARVVDIDRRLDVSGITPGMRIDYSKITSASWLVEATIGCDYTLNSAPAAKNNIMSQAPSIDIPGLAECLTANYTNLSSDRLGVGVTARVGKMINRILYSARLNYNYLDIDAGARCHTVALTLGATF